MNRRDKELSGIGNWIPFLLNLSSHRMQIQMDYSPADMLVTRHLEPNVDGKCGPELGGDVSSRIGCETFLIIS